MAGAETSSHEEQRSWQQSGQLSPHSAELTSRSQLFPFPQHFHHPVVGGGRVQECGMMSLAKGQPEIGQSLLVNTNR